MAEEKKMTDFHECDRVEFKCAGVVSKVTPLSVHVRLADLDDIVEMPVPPLMLRNLSEVREMTLESGTKRSCLKREHLPRLLWSNAACC